MLCALIVLKDAQKLTKIIKRYGLYVVYTVDNRFYYIFFLIIHGKDSNYIQQCLNKWSYTYLNLIYYKNWVRLAYFVVLKTVIFEIIGELLIEKE